MRDVANVRSVVKGSPIGAGSSAANGVCCFDRTEEFLKGARPREHVFEFAESVFNGRKIGRIGRQKQEV